MSPKIPVKCAMAGCHRRLKMTPEQREELRQAGQEHNAVAGIVCPRCVKAAFNFEYDDIDIDVPLEEYLIEAARETPRWRMMLSPLPKTGGEAEGHGGSGQEGQGQVTLL